MIFGYEKDALPYTLVVRSHLQMSKNIIWYHDISTDNKTWGRFGRDNFYYYIDIPDIGIARLQNKNQIVEFYNIINLDQVQVESFFLHHLLPLLLSLRNKTLLHSGAFVLNDFAYLYLGPTGVGKSTLSLQLLKIKKTILGDDALLINYNKNKCFVYAGTKTIRFQSDMPSILTENLNIKGSYFNKFIIKLEDHIQPLPFYNIGALLFLVPGQNLNIKKISSLDAFPLLLSHTFRIETEDTQLQKNEMIRLNDLISHTPCYQVSWPKKFSELECNTRMLLDYF